MKYLVLDTCIILHILRNNEIGLRAIKLIESFTDDPLLVISAVTKGELESLKKQQNWGESKCLSLNRFLENVIYIDVNHGDEKMHQSYALIDAFSKRKSNDNHGNLINGSAKKMGKNDLWIAATAHVLNASLLTTDGDFDHLDGKLIRVIKP
jgi:predicted nucleic acid-binding protein